MAAQSEFIADRKMSDFLKLVEAACGYIVFLPRGNQVPTGDARSGYRWCLPDL